MKKIKEKFSCSSRSQEASSPLGEVSAKLTERKYTLSCYHPKIGRKVAFTLAEVLITLGIIGVVAAITLPTLIQNYQKHVYYNQYKSSVSILAQGLKKIMADDGVTYLSHTDTFSSINGASCYTTQHAPNGNECKNFYNKLRKNFKIISIANAPSSYKWKYLGTKYKNDLRSVTGQVISLANGSILWDTRFLSVPDNPYIANSVNKRMAYIILDTNGFKGPNTFGRDIFELWADDTGLIFPRGSKRYSLLVKGNETDMYWRTSTSESVYCKMNNVVWGNGCGARLEEEGKMDY